MFTSIYEIGLIILSKKLFIHQSWRIIRSFHFHLKRIILWVSKLLEPSTSSPYAAELWIVCLGRVGSICKHRLLKGVLAIFLKWKLNILMHLNQMKNSDIKMHNGLALWTLLFNIIKLRCLQKRKSCHTISR